MSYYLQNFEPNYFSNIPKECQLEDVPCCSFTAGTTLNPNETSRYNKQANRCNAEKESPYRAHQKKIRKQYSKLLALWAKNLYKNASLHSVTSAASNLDTYNRKEQQDSVHNNVLQRVSTDLDATVVPSSGEFGAELLAEAQKYTNVVAPCSIFGANALAQTAVLRYSNFLDSENGDVSSKARAESLELWMEKARIFNEAKSTDGIPGKKDNGGFELVTIGLDSIFSVMVELNQRDPELCSQALQSLLQLLQNLPAESLSREPKSVVERMHSLLKQLRIEGNASVSVYANACLVSLAVACGHPQYIYSTVETLLCDAKKNVPFNQLCSECNMLPKNFHTLALNIQRYVYRGCPPTKTDKISQWRALLSSGESLCDFELVFPSNQSSYSDYGHSESTTSNVSHGSVVSNGSFVFMLTNYGLLKVGSGLTETKCGEVLSSNEILKYIDGSVLLVCNESLYLRRKHSSRLWVLDVETLREIGEIMLPASLSSEGVLFSDGKSFFHANLDEQWNFITTPLDDSSFMPLSNPRLKQCHRLAEIDYGVFGDTSQLNELFGSIPNSLQGVAVDIQICSNVAFILTRQGKVFYSGRGSALDLQDATKDEWLELPLSEHIVGMTGQSGSCLIMRSGAGHIWALGNLGEFFDNQTGAHQQQRTPSKKPRKIRIPNKRKCVSVAATAGCMAMTTDSGKCIFHGRHIITTTSNTLSALDSIGAVATVALGRTHAVFVTKNGMLYSCGLNNMNQCGRHETQSTAATTSRNNPGSTSPNIATSYEYSEDANLLQIRTTSNQSPNRSPLPTEDSQNEHSFVRRAGISAQIARRRESGDKLGANFGLQFPDTTGGAILSPSRVVLLRPTNDIKVATVSVGNYHTVVLSADHQVFTFGSNVNGQLGTGDTLRRPGAHRVNLPSNVQVVQAVAGANHCVLRTSAGQVITFGAYKNGQLGRRPADKHKQTTTEPTSIFPGPTNREWFAEPGFVQGFGQTHGRLASWVGAQSDRTIIQCQRQVISQADLANCQVTANQEYILVVPSNKRGCNNKNYVVIGRQPYIGVNHFKISSAGALVGRSVCLDPRYSALLWSFDAVRMRVFAHSLDSQDSISVTSKSYDKSKQISEPSFLKKHRKFFATTALLLPSESENRFSDVQIAVYMLSMMYNLNIGAVAGTFESSVSTDVQGGKRQSSFGANEANGNFCPNDCSTVNRFESYGGGWGYSAHCVEAIQFKTNSDIFFCGVGLFGGRGEYMGKLKLFRVIGGADVEEQCVELLAETDEVIYECAPRETTFLRLAKGVEVRANQWHVIWAQIQGPSSDCGAAGQATVRNPADNVEFNFRTSLLSNNGTDVDVGQIPEIYYRLEKSSNRSVGTSRQTSRSPADEFGPAETSEESPAANLTYPKCLLKIEPGVMSHLYRILDWAIQGTLMMANSKDINNTDANWKQERAAFIGIVALRIIRLYIRILYKDGEENDAEIDRDHMSRAIEPIVRLHQTLIELFSSADKKLFNSDDTCLLLVDECIDAYVSCASLFVPSPQILRVHLSNAVVQAENLGSYRCWFLFALLRVFSHLDNYILPILDDRNGEVNAVKGGLLAAKLAEEFAASQKAGQSTQETTVTSSQQIKFLFTLAFANVDSDNVECDLTARLKYAAQEVIVKITKALVDAGLNIDSGPVLLQTPNRFQKISSQMNWDVDGDAYDAIAFKIDSSTINLHGAGVFLNCTSRSQCEYELGLLVNKGDSVNESWTLIEQTSGTVSDQTLMGGVDQIGDGVYANNDNGPPLQVVMIRFGRPVTLKPGVCYAVRVMLNAGKSFYGEDGICSVRLQNNAHITFFPCSLSQNGTTILRGQIPSLLYSVDKSPVKSRRHSEPHRNGFWFDQRTSIGLQNEIQENVPNGDLETSPEQTQQLFVQILRLLAQKLSSKMMISGQIPPTDRNTCSRLVAYGNVFVELHPWMTFDLIAAFDEVLPLMANLATDDENEDQDKSLNNAITASDKNMTLSKPTVQSVVESAHPYKSGQIYSQKVSFNPSVQFLSIRFHDECQTAQSGDVLWIYASVTENAKGSTFYPIGKYSGDRGWPVDTVVLVPGNLVWFVLETSPLQDQDCMDATKMYGFRCTVDGIFTNLSASIQSSPTSEILGQEFTWFCANACRQLVQLPNTSNISHLREFSAGEQRTRDLVRRHGALLKRGLNIGTPVLKEVLQKRLPGAKQCQESQFLKDFISSDLETSAGTLARAIVGRPFVDLANCVMEVIPNEGLYYVGQSLRIQILLKDQFDRPIYAISQNNNKLDVEIFISCGISGLEVMVENDEILASRKALKSLQMSEPFRSVYVNKARYMSITMMSAFADHSFEELRLAYQHDSAIRTTLKLEREQPISEDRDQNLGPSSLASSISFSGIWTPRRAGRYTMQCSIDGFNLKSLKHVNVSEAVYSSSLVYSSNLVGSASKSQEQKVTEIESNKNLTATPRHASGIARPENQKQNMAVCESTADFRGIRVRTHPTLSANNQIGVISRGGAFEYTEILKNADGVWLKMASDARSLYCDHHRSYSTQAWCLQFNNHLQVQYLTLPVQNGPKLSVDHQIAPKLTPKQEKAQQSIPQTSSQTGKSSGQASEVALTPVVLDCLRCVFAAFVWHSPGKIQNLITAANHLKSQPEIRQSLQRAEFGHFSRSSANTNNLPGVVQKVVGLWNEISGSTLAVLEKQMILPSPLDRNYSAHKIGAGNDMEVKKPSEKNGQADELCELCDGRFPKPITTHMRVRHPGCGGPSFSHGYNSVGHYTTGWTGTCGDGGQGNAVWYLLCPNCWLNYLKKGTSKPPYMEDSKKPQIGLSAYDSTTSKPSVEAILKRNALFLLELRPAHDEVASALNNQQRRPKHTEEWKIDMYPSGSPLPVQSGIGVRHIPSDMGNLAAMDEDVMSSADEDEFVEYTTSADILKHSPYRHPTHLSDPGTAGYGMTYDSMNFDELAGMQDIGSLSASANLYKREAGFSQNAYKFAVGNQILYPTTTQRRSSSLLPRQHTIAGDSGSHPGEFGLFQHPIMAFLVENHDLDVIRQIFNVSIFRAVAFSYAFKVWNWLLKLVTSESSVTDIIWHHLTALSSYTQLNHYLTPSASRFATQLRLLPHPARLAVLAGEPLTRQMVGDFHALLSTLGVILQSPSVDLRLKCLCFKAWTFQLTGHEQNLLITLCNLLATVGSVLSDTSSLESQLSLTACSSSHPPARKTSSDMSYNGSNRVAVQQMENISEHLVLDASSRSKLLACLIDGTCETFWESGDEDKNRTRRLTAIWEPNVCSANLLAIFIDNISDEGFRVSQITIRAIDNKHDDNKTLTSPSRVNIKGMLCNSQLDRSFVGWVKCDVSGMNTVQIILKGDEAGCRLRQIVLFGTRIKPDTSSTDPTVLTKTGTSGIKPSTSHQLLFSSAQMDAFALFQAISAQAFSDEFAEEQNGTLRQQVLDLLFNRVQLQPLQSYVCFQMVSAVEREVINLRGRGKRNYSYVSGLMAMLTKICESRKGLEVFSTKNGLLIVLSEMLLFAPQIIQFQTVDTIERLIGHFKPWMFDSAQFVQNILAVLAKSITLQIKDKMAHKVYTHTLANHAVDIPPYWRIDRQVSPEIAHALLKLCERIANGSMSDQWSLVFRTHVADSIMALCAILDLSGSHRDQMSEANCSNFQIKTAQFWLSGASLAVISDANWLELSENWRILKSRQNQEPDSLCENHEDGRTLSHLHCEVCQMDLCRECFTVLHLSKRNKGHRARLIGSAAVPGCPRVDIHEGCTRLRLNHLLVLVNTSKLSGVVEIGADAGANVTPAIGRVPSGLSDQSVPGPSTSAASGTRFWPGAVSNSRCRFCSNPLKSEEQQICGVCDYFECRQLSEHACPSILPCGHWCSGIRGETKCLPCFHCRATDMRQDADDLCAICFVDRLGEAPCVQLKCNHFFHYKCVRTVLEKRWHGPRIVFRFMECPLCKEQIDHTAFADLLSPLMELKEAVAKKAKLRLEYDGLLNHPAVTSNNSAFHNDPSGYAMDRYMYVLCYRCNKAYFGGESRCQEALDSSVNFNPEELLCGGCSTDLLGGEVCGRHGAEYLEYKCRYCCTVAVYFCFGTTHFCAGCHSDFQRLLTIPKQQLPKCPAGPKAQQLQSNEGCPLGVQHPATGEEFSLGCGVCRNLRTF